MIGIILCTKECNLRCKYCFEESGFKTCNMLPMNDVNDEFESGMDNWKRFGEEIVKYNKKRKIKSQFTFHGGEPLLIKAKYIDELCSYYRKLDDVSFNIQTNGTIIDDEIIDILKYYNFRVGVSIDGTERMHNQNRIGIGGNGTHSIVLSNIKKMINAGVPVGTMATITQSISERPKQFYDFFKELGVSVGFNACYTSPNADNGNNIDDIQYCKFLKELFDLWIADNESKIMIQPFERIIRNIISPNKGMRVCQYMEDCREVNVAVDYRGKIYQCLHYCNLTGGEIGDLNETSLENIMHRRLAEIGHWEREKETSCKGCDVYNFCYGGCPYWKDAEELTGLQKDFNCVSQKYIVHYIYNYLKMHSK